MTKRFAFLFQFLLNTLAEVGIFQFRQLEAQEILIVVCLVNRLLHLLDRLLGRQVLLVQLTVLLQLFLVIGNDIHHVQLEVFFLKEQVLVL